MKLLFRPIYRRLASRWDCPPAQHKSTSTSSCPLCTALGMLFDFPKSLFLTVMGDWAVVMPNRPGEKKTTYSQTLLVFLLPSIIIRIHQRTAEVSLAAEDSNMFQTLHIWQNSYMDHGQKAENAALKVSHRSSFTLHTS